LRWCFRPAQALKDPKVLQVRKDLPGQQALLDPKGPLALKVPPVRKANPVRLPRWWSFLAPNATTTPR
jgi:hypothetical protein